MHVPNEGEKSTFNKVSQEHLFADFSFHCNPFYLHVLNPSSVFLP